MPALDTWLPAKGLGNSMYGGWGEEITHGYSVSTVVTVTVNPSGYKMPLCSIIVTCPNENKLKSHLVTASSSESKISEYYGIVSKFKLNKTSCLYLLSPMTLYCGNGIEYKQ